MTNRQPDLDERGSGLSLGQKTGPQANVYQWSELPSLWKGRTTVKKRWRRMAACKFRAAPEAQEAELYEQIGRPKIWVHHKT